MIPTLAPALEPLYRQVLESGEPVVHTESTDDAALHIGERRHWLSSYYPVRTADGETIGVGGLIIEITDRKRADDRLRLLAEAGELFSTSLDRDEIAARIAQVAVPRLADTCNVYVGSGDRLERIACVNTTRGSSALARVLPASFALEGPGPACSPRCSTHASRCCSRRSLPSTWPTSNGSGPIRPRSKRSAPGR